MGVYGSGLRGSGVIVFQFQGGSAPMRSEVGASRKAVQTIHQRTKAAPHSGYSPGVKTPTTAHCERCRMVMVFAVVFVSSFRLLSCLSLLHRLGCAGWKTQRSLGERAGEGGAGAHHHFAAQKKGHLDNHTQEQEPRDDQRRHRQQRNEAPGREGGGALHVQGAHLHVNNHSFLHSASNQRSAPADAATGGQALQGGPPFRLYPGRIFVVEC